MNVIITTTTIKVLSFHCNQFCSSTPLFRHCQFQANCQYQDDQDNDNSKLKRLQEMKTGEWKNI
jgi:hypothetical protein